MDLHILLKLRRVRGDFIWQNMYLLKDGLSVNIARLKKLKKLLTIIKQEQIWEVYLIMKI